MTKQYAFLRNLFRVLLPSFVADFFFAEHRRTWKVHPTSYLDGLRGIASVIVFFCHYTETNFGSLVPAYGLDDKHPSGWIQLPYLRLIFSGRPMVHIFFIISGFALSYKPIKAIHARDLDKCYTALASSTFRRAFRLFGPCIASTFMIMCLAQMKYMYYPRPKDTWSEQFWAWKGVIFHQITWPWSWDFDWKPGYDIHLWTIPIEFAHSMLLFIVILMVSRLRLRIRQAMIVAIMIYCLMCGKWAGFEFIGGLFLAELHVLQSARKQGWESPIKGFGAPKSVFRSLKVSLQILILAVGLFIGGWPNQGAEKTPGIRWFLAHTPYPFFDLDALAPQKYWFGLSAFFIVWVVGDMRPLKKFFESSFAQYCGRVSYAVYICHGPMLILYERKVLGRPFVPAVGEPGTPDYKQAIPGKGVRGFTGVEGTTQLTMAWFFGLCILGPIVIWASDLFWRGIDDPIVKLGRKMEMACLDDGEEKESPRSLGYSPAA